MTTPTREQVALRELGKRMAALLDEDQWGVIEPYLNDLEATIAEQAAEIARLKAEKEYRYVEQILSPIRRLLKVAKCAESLADNSEEMEGEDGRIHAVIAVDFDELSDALDLLDELPDDKPGYVMNGPARAEWALRDVIGDRP